MAVLKCKMCGGDLFFEEGASTCVCDYCGNTNTLPITSSDQEMNLFNRANHFRMINEFDKAIAAYEKILDADDTNAEAHWGIVLSRYGIEYVEDPVSHERIPTCHRVQMTGILSDPDYLAAVEHADFLAASEYKAQAERIAEIQKGILAISSREKPYDVFICYKETDENGSRTVDSTLAQDIYYGLTESGYRVFFSRITLEDKLGQEYEPYIFAALNSAKVMVAVGTKPEHFNAVWVKNEWSRYLDLMKNDRHRLLIPCYRDMDPYDLPDELSMLQSQDMSKIGFMQDLLRGIKKVLGEEEKKPVQQEKVVQAASGTTVSAQIKRGNMALEDQDWKRADDFFEEALNLDPECAEAYLGKLLVQNKKKSWEELVSAWCALSEQQSTEWLQACSPDTEHIDKIVEEYAIPSYLDGSSIRQLYIYDLGYDSALSCRRQQKEIQLKNLAGERHLQRAKQYAKGGTKAQIEEGLRKVSTKLDERISKARQDDAASIEKIKSNYAAFLEQTDIKAAELNEDAKERREQDYQDAVAKMKEATDAWSYENVRKKITAMGGYKDSVELISECNREIKRLEEEKRKEEERETEARRQQALKAAKKKKIISGIVAGMLAACVAGYFIIIKVIIPNNDYKAAVALMADGNYLEAISAFEALNGYKDSGEQIEACKTGIKDKKYDAAVALMESGDYDDAITMFKTLGLGGYKDSTEQIKACETAIKDNEYYSAVALKENGDYEGAIAAFEAMENYRDSKEQIEACETAIKDKKYDAAVALMDSDDYVSAYLAFQEISGYKDSEKLKNSIMLEHNKDIVFATAEVGSVVAFGAYEQDNDEANGKEDIEWIVLDKKDDRLLVISQYGLECKEYHDKYWNTTWEECSLREWLNSTFLSVAFTEEEQEMIPTVSVKAENNEEYNTNAGNDTEDKIFLLCISEAEKYFSSDVDRKCEPTSYAEAKGAAGRWWLRSPGYDSKSAAAVNSDGSVYYIGLIEGYSSCCVRPVLWINLKS